MIVAIMKTATITTLLLLVCHSAFNTPNSLKRTAKTGISIAIPKIINVVKTKLGKFCMVSIYYHTIYELIF